MNATRNGPSGRRLLGAALLFACLLGPATADPSVAEPAPGIEARLREAKQAVLEAAVRIDLDAASAAGTIPHTPPPDDSPGWLAEQFERALRVARSTLAPDVDPPLEDPRLREAARLLDAGRPFSAARALQQFDAMPDTTQRLAPDWAALYARALLAYGLPAPAQALLEPSADGAAISRRLMPARIALAEFQARHGDVDAALASLSALPARLVGTQDYEARMLRARLLMARHEDAEAAKLLARIQPDVQALLKAPAADVYRALLPQYNLGIALLRAGQSERGRGLLDRIGRLETRDPDVLVLRDRANLALGWQFLREAQGATARPIFERIALEGPSSNSALLGLGWAALAPQGNVQAREDIAAAAGGDRETPKFVLRLLQRRQLINCEEYNRLARAPDALCNSEKKFEQAAVPADPAKLAEQALAPWIELQAREAEDPAVRESWTALPHALAQLGAQRAAQEYYDAAVAKLEATLARNASLRRQLAAQSLVLPAAFTTPLREPASPVTPRALFALWHVNNLDLLPDNATLAEAATNLLDVLWLQQQAEPLALPAERVEALDALRADCERELAARADAELAAQAARLQAYLTAARAGLATLYDPALPPP